MLLIPPIDRMAIEDNRKRIDLESYDDLHVRPVKSSA